MNHCYRLIWNRMRHCFVVAAETSRGRGKSGSSERSARTVRAGSRAWFLAWPLALVPLLGMATGPGNAGALAAPHALVAPAASPVGGTVTAGSGSIRHDGLTTTIDQHSQNLSLNWQSFDVGAASTVNFAQPNAQSIAVNRIAGSNGSVILGHLNANGQVFLINPNGVLFGRSAQVNVGGLVASTLDMGDGDLASGTRHFFGGGQGSVINQGSLSANEGGYIALLGPQVTNQGTLRAPGGTVAMGGGTAVSLSFDNNHLLSLQVDKSTLNALADNRQLIVADGGQVLMSAGAKDALLTSVVNNTGVIQAQTVGHHNGRIVLLGGMAAGTTQVAGTLDASAPSGGNGGFIETSATHVQVADGAKITTLASTGTTGTWLIDPQDYTIAATGGDMTGAALSTGLAGNNVSIQSASGAHAGTGNIHLNDAVSWSANTTLTLTASNDVNINANVTATGASAGLVLAPNTANGADAASGSGQYHLANGAVITLSGATPSLSIAGSTYTVINSLGAPGSMTGTDLQGINGNLSGKYALGSDIDASATSSWDNGAGFYPIGYSGFQGSFDGLGHTITGLYGRGFFAITATGSAVRNVGLFARNAFASYSLGGLVQNNYGTIDQAFVIGSVVSSGNFVGGLVADNYGTISRSHVGGVVSAQGNVGGLVGRNLTGATITQSYSTATVSGSGAPVGGLVGINNGATISQSYATGAVSGLYWVGGLAGLVQDAGSVPAMVTQSWASGKVTGAAVAGGLIGYGYSADASYWDSYSSGQAMGTGNGNVAGLTAVTSDPAQAAASNSAFKQSAYATLDFAAGNGGWVMIDGSTRPFLQSEYSTNIGNAHQLQLAAMKLGAAYTLASNVDASETARVVNSAASSDAAGMWSNGGFSSLGNGTTPFTGSFDGQGHTITGLTINRPQTDAVGLFGQADSASTIRNIGLLGGSLTAHNNIGSLVGVTSGTVSQAYAITPVTGVAGVGGLVGILQAGGTLSQSYATGAVTSPNSGGYATGGLVGASTGTISQSYATGTVSGDSNVGGLLGLNWSGGAIQQSYATGAVSGNEIVGGLVGSDIFPASTLLQSYSTGAVHGTANTVGGLIGFGRNETGTSYWDMQASGQLKSSGGSGLTSAQMKDAASFTGWDLATTGGSNSVWRIYNGQTAPLLRTFMTALSVTASNATVTYNSTAFAGSTYGLGAVTPSLWLPATVVNPTLVSGTVNTATPTINAGTYTSALNSGLYSGQIGYDITLTPGTLTINQAPLGISGASAANKTYDGTTTASISGAALTGTIYGTDTVMLGSASAGTFANKNVGTSKAVTVRATLGGASAANYQLTQPTGLTAAITPASLTYSATGATTTYGTPATGLTGTLSGFVAGDTTSSATTGTAAFDTTATATSNVGSYAISGSGLSANNGNYTFTQAPGNATALTLNPAALSISTSDVNKVYDGNTTALGTAIATAGTLFGTDNLSGGIFTFDTRDMGTNKTVNVSAVTVNDGNSGNNYALTYAPNTHSSITARPVSVDISASIANVSGIAADNKVYDGNTRATLDFGSAMFNGMASGDSLVVGSAIGMFSDKNAGIGKTVFISGISLGGNDAANYTLLDNTARTTADITPLGIMVAASGRNKVYDGTTAATVALANNGVLAGDSVSFTTSGSFADKNVGSAKAITVSDIAATGADAGNYRVNTSASASADITPATLTYVAKPGSAAAGALPTLTGAVTGLVGGDTVGTATTGSTTWSTPATASSPVGQYAIDGSGLAAANYLFQQAASNVGALQLTADSQSTTATPQDVATIVAQLQQESQPTPGSQQQDDDNPCTPSFATLCSAKAGLPVPLVRIINGGVRMP